MSPTSRILAYLALIFAAFGLFTGSATAGLSGPPESHIVVRPDDRHMLVFLSPVTPDEDEGKIAKLPDGREVNLRETFPATGYYEIGSTTPIWTAPWSGEDGWSVSDDGQFLVRWHYRAKGAFDGWEGDLSWLLKFYDRGKEIKSYNAAELIDYPRLLPFDNGYHFFGDTEDNLTINGDEFILDTSTHESYRFDIRTAEVVEQFRMWRMVAMITWCVIVASILWKIAIRLRRGTTSKASPEIEIPSASLRRRFQDFIRKPGYSLRSLLFATTAIALSCFVLPRWPKSWPLILIAGIAVYVTRATMRYQRNVGFGWRSILAGLGWLSAYVLSLGPVAVFLRGLEVPEDVFFAILLNLYRPLIWVHITWPTIPLWPEWWTQLWESVARLLQ